MSTYSLDSLENDDENTNNNSTLNEKNIDAKSNETTWNGSRHDRRSKISASRNAIITKRGVANVAHRLESTKKNNWQSKRPCDNRTRSCDGKNQNEIGCTESKNTELSSRITSWKCSFRSVSVDRSVYDNAITRPNKKLGNVLAPIVNVRKKSASYLEFYHQKTSASPCYRRIRSPEGSTLSIYGDSQREELTEDDNHISFSSSPRDDESELSFYRRLIQRSENQAPRTARSCESVRQKELETFDDFPKIRGFKSSISDSKLERKPNYKPYTVEDYKTLPMPKPDRSLGPDKIEVQSKREKLMRRRSYGNSASVRNRQQILQRAHRFKNSQDSTDLKVNDTRKNNAREKNRSLDRSNGSTKPKKDASSIAIATGKRKTLARPMNLRSSQNDIFEDSYLENLRQRHLREKELVEKLLREATIP